MANELSKSNQDEISSSLLPETIKKCRILHDGGPLFFCHPVGGDRSGHRTQSAVTQPMVKILV